LIEWAWSASRDPFTYYIMAYLHIRFEDTGFILPKYIKGYPKVKIRGDLGWFRSNKTIDVVTVLERIRFLICFFLETVSNLYRLRDIASYLLKVENFPTPRTFGLLLAGDPVGISIRSLSSEDLSPLAVMWQLYLRDDIFGHFDRTADCERHRQTHDHSIAYTALA